MSQIPLIEKSIRLVVSLAAFPLSISQLLLTRYHLSKYKPTGSLFRVGQHSLHAIVTGDSKPNTPTVILESGMGGCSLDWSLVQPELSKHTKVMSYDRAGFGWSSKSRDQPTCSNYVKELRSLLQAANIKPPYILVGHSYGGMIVRLYASQFPEEVTGLILVDSTPESRYLHNNMSDNRKAERTRNLTMFRLGYLFSPIGIPRLLKRHVGANRLPSEVQRTVTVLGYRNDAFEGAYLELLHAEDSAVQLSNAAPLSNDMPVVVLTAGRQNEDWKKGQQELLNLTERTEQILAEDSWHSIQIHKPQIVVEAVKRILHNYTSKSS